MNLETFEHNQPLTGTIDEQRYQRRQAFILFLADVMKRRLSKAEIAELRKRLRERAKVSA
jgi:hypothetical protein